MTFRVPVFDWYGSMYIFAHTGEVVCRKAYRRLLGDEGLHLCGISVQHCIPCGMVIIIMQIQIMYYRYIWEKAESLYDIY